MTTNPPAVSDTPVLKLLNVESAYGPIKAIRGVSLQVRRGEIATVLGCSRNAVRVRLHRARRRFAAALERQETELTTLRGDRA